MEIGKRKIMKGMMNSALGVIMGIALVYGYEFCREQEDTSFPEGTFDEQVQSFLQWDERKLISELEHWEKEAQIPHDYCDNFSMKDLFSMSFLSARLGMMSPQKGIALLPRIPKIAPRVSRRLFSAWSECRPEEAFACFKQKGRALYAHKKILLTVARNLIKIKPEAMRELLDSLPEENRESFTPVAFSFLMKFHPGLVLSSLSEWEKTGAGTKKMYAEIAREWAAEDWESAQAWIRTLSPDWQDDLRLFSLPGLMKKNEAEASRIFVSLTYQDQKRILPFLLKTLTDQSPLIALKWMTERVEKYVYWEYVEMTMGNEFYVSGDVKDFIIGMKDESAKDKALSYMCDGFPLYYLGGYRCAMPLGYYRHLPEEVLKWGCLMSGWQKYRQLGLCLTCWNDYDYESAQKWFNKAGFSESEKKKIEMEVVMYNSLKQ